MPDASRLRISRSHFHVCLLLVMAIANICPALAAAAPPTLSKQGDIVLSPVQQQLTLASGLVQARTKLTLTNRSDQDLAAVIEAVDFEASGENGAIALDSDKRSGSKYSLLKWVVFPGGSSVQLPKGATVDVPVLINNETDLAPGGHYAALVVRVSTAADTSGNHVSFKQELISLLFVNKVGGAKFGLQLESLSNDAKGSDYTAQVSLRFRSTGNVYVVPRGYVTLTDSKNTVLSKAIINPESNLILPASSRTLTAKLEPINSGKGVRVIGPLKLTAYYRYDEQSKFTTKSITVSQFNTHLYLIAILAITGIAIGLILFKKQQASSRFSARRR